MKRIVPVLLLAFAAPLAAQPPQGGQRPDPADMFMQNLDTNKDGKVSKEEYLKPGEEQFRQIDKNGDGAITRDEADAYHKEMQQRMEQMRQQTQQQRQGGEEPGAPAGQYPQR